ncbi:glutamate-gated chloride channel, partial [Nephila pilipes]
AIDIWTGVCLTFVFGALLEFALVNYASRNEDHKKQAKQRKWDLEKAAALEAERIDNATTTFGMVSMFLRGTVRTQVKALYKSRYQYRPGSFSSPPEMDNE